MRRWIGSKYLRLDVVCTSRKSPRLGGEALLRLEAPSNPFRYFGMHIECVDHCFMITSSAHIGQHHDETAGDD